MVPINVQFERDYPMIRTVEKQYESCEFRNVEIRVVSWNRYRYESKTVHLREARKSKTLDKDLVEALQRVLVLMHRGIIQVWGDGVYVKFGKELLVRLPAKGD